MQNAFDHHSVTTHVHKKVAIEHLDITRLPDDSHQGPRAVKLVRQLTYTMAELAHSANSNPTTNPHM